MKVWEEMDAELTELWDLGMSGDEIGRRLGKTKNAVIGRVHRLGLKKRRNARGTHKRAMYMSRGKPRGLTAKPDFGGVHGRCQWLEGEPKERRFCGREAVARSYCAAHYARAYQVVKAANMDEAA